MSKTEKQKSVWETLSRIDVSNHTEDKNGFTYLSWAWAWSTLKDHYPNATFEKHLNPVTQLPFFRDDESGTAFVRVTVSTGATPDGITAEATETFPVLDYKNKAVVNPSAMDINTALQRGMTKAISYLGLGAYIYAGEDLPPGPRVVEVKGSDGAVEKAEGPEMVAKIFETFIPTMDTVPKLEDFWINNKQAIDVLKSDQSVYADVLAKFKRQKTSLEKKEKADG